jgi:hypothetical protein
MMHAPHPDCFVIVNGPQDGTEYPITRAPFRIGQDPNCAVNLRLDTNVRPYHAQGSVVSEGYRIRRLDAAPVFVNGKRVGAVRSRIVRSGGTVQVGNTLLILECAPDGLASRSRGIMAESDLAWALRHGVLRVRRFLRAAWKTARFVLGRLLTSWLAIAALLLLCYVFWPWFRDKVDDMAFFVYDRIVNGVISRLTGSP